MPGPSQPAGPATQSETVGAKNDPSNASTSSPRLANVSVPRRMLLATVWMVIGLIFFYLVMVALSAIQKGINLDRIAANGWPRTASRHTGAVAVLPLAAFLLCDKSRRRSLLFAVLLGCALFCHFVILASDLRVYADDEVMEQMLYREKTHPVFGLLGPFAANLWRELFSVGLLASLFLAMERTYGPALGERRAELPLLSKAAMWWIVVLNVVTYVDQLVGVMLKKDREIADVIYPIYFLVLLFVSATYYYADGIPSGPPPAESEQAEKKDQ